MRGLLDDGSRSIIFLVDTAGCAISTSVRAGRDIRFRRSVAREYSTLLISAIERLLAHADEGAPGGVLWTYRIFDSRDGLATSCKTAPVRSSLSRATITSIEECSKALMSSMHAACELQSVSTTCLEKVSTAITDGISTISTRGSELYSPDSFLESTDTDATPSKKSKQERDKTDSEPLVVLFAAAPQTKKEIPTFFGGRHKNDLINFEGPQLEKLDSGACQTLSVALENNMRMQIVLETIRKSKSQLLWIHAYSRRAEEPNCFSPGLINEFKTWMEKNDCVNAFEDLYSLLIDRSVAPFAALARRAARPAMEKAVEISTATYHNAQEWVPVDFLVSSTSVPDNIDGANDRVLKAEFCGVLPPVSKAEPKKYRAVCVGLLQLPCADTTLSFIESVNEAPGLLRPSRKRLAEFRPANECASENQWIGAFSGLMLSLAQAGLSLVVSIMSDDISSSSGEPFKTVIISALTPLCAIVRPADAAVFKRLQLEPVLSGSILPPADSNALRKRIFPGLGKLGSDFSDCVGEAWSATQSARFFEAHLSNSGIMAHQSEVNLEVNECGKALQNASKYSTPHSVATFLEELNAKSEGKHVEQLRFAIANSQCRLNDEQDCTIFGYLDDGKQIMDTLEKSLAEAKSTKLTHPTSSSGPELAGSEIPEVSMQTSTAENNESDEVKLALTVPDQSCEIGSHSVPCTPPPLNLPQSPIANAASALLMMSASPPLLDSCVREGEQTPDEAPARNPETDSSESMITTICDQIDEDIRLIKSIDKMDVVMQCHVVLRSLGRLVDFWRDSDFSSAVGPFVKARVRRLKKIQKGINLAEEARATSERPDNPDRSLLFFSMKCYQQVTLSAAKQTHKFSKHVNENNVNLKDMPENSQRVLKKSLKRTSKFLNTALAVAVSQNHSNSDDNPYQEVFDEFFNSVISRFYTQHCTPSCVLANGIMDEFEKSFDSSRCGSVALNQATDAAASLKLVSPVENQSLYSSPVAQRDKNPSISKRSRSREYDRRECPERKRPRTRDLKRVLAEATASRSVSRIHQVAPRRESALGLRSLEREKDIQRPLQTKGMAHASSRKSLRSTDPLFMFNMGRRMKYSISERLKQNEWLNTCNSNALSGANFYAKASEPLQQTGSNEQNEVLVPGTPSDEGE